MAQLADIPNEILLEVFAYLPLKSLIAGSGASRHLRQLIPHADIYPPRRALLDLYLEILASPLFSRTRPWVVDRLRPFDRQGYIDTLQQQHPYLPEEFCLWVLEWPARAAIRTAWPGLPVYGHHTADNVEKIGGENWLGAIPPELSAVDFGSYPPFELIPALCLSIEYHDYTWLVLDERIGIRGKVYVLWGGDYLDPEDGFDEDDEVYANFIDWQRGLWQKVEAEAAFRATDTCAKIEASIQYKGERAAPMNRPCPRWCKRHESGL